MLTKEMIERIRTNREHRLLIGNKANTKEAKDNWQQVSTPIETVVDMLNHIEVSHQYIIMFAFEFIDILVHDIHIDPVRIIFIADTEIEEKFAKTLYGCKTSRMNKNWKLETNLKVLSRTIKENEMKTDSLVIIGNPPYQKPASDHCKSAKPIYQHFVDACRKLKPRYLSFITPSRWMQGGMGLDEFRESMMKDRHIRLIRHFPGHQSVFKDVSIAGGVSYFLWDREYTGDCDFNGVKRRLDKYDVIVTDNGAITILDKVLAVMKKPLSESVSAINPFGICSNFSDFKEEGVTCYTKGAKKHYIDKSVITDRDHVLHLYKCCLSKTTFNDLNFTRGKSKIINVNFIAKPDEVVSDTYLVLKVFETEEEAKNFMTYLHTKTFRFMMACRIHSQQLSRSTFAFVPDLEDYSHSWDDAQVCQTLGLTDEDFTYIESRIR